MSDPQFPDEPTLPEPAVPEADIPSQPELRPLVHDESINPNDPSEGAVPPGYDWPTHGGYLGCLLGVMASCLLGGFVGSTMFPALAHYNLVPGWVAGLLTLVVYVLLVGGIGRLGYLLGRRFLREYPQPTGKTWGEDDDFHDDIETATGDTGQAGMEPTGAEDGVAQPASPPQNGAASGMPGGGESAGRAF